jgi:alginate O-acetyltransferase complex protein AlgI
VHTEDVVIFSSFEFIVLFLPLVVIGYFLIAKRNLRFADHWLIAASLIFYGWWNLAYVALVIASTIFNFYMGRAVIRSETRSKALMLAGVAINLLVLCVFKYTDFLIATMNTAAETQIPLLHILLPLGISFMTFQKIAWLVDCHRHKADPGSLTRFTLFITFFPQLIAGPIVHHHETMPQFAEPERKRVNWDSIAAGLFLFSIGLFKKVFIADHLAGYATWGFDEAAYLSFTEAWLTVLSYTFQIYFDFSGYTDMALGTALLFNIRLPQNFNSPYKATSIRDFWRHWHMTLSRFLRDYLYIPLGGNRKGISLQVAAIMVTFILGGLWHGPSWNFALWGLMHGTALAIYLGWERVGFKLPRILGWLLTFIFVCLTWVVFRALDWAAAVKVYAGLINIQDMGEWNSAPQLPFFIIAGFALCLLFQNSNQLVARFRPALGWLLLALGAALSGFFYIGGYSEFLYFQF